MKIKVTFTTEIPDGTDYDHIEEWLRFHLNATSVLHGGPLSNRNIEAEYYSIDFREVSQ